MKANIGYILTNRTDIVTDVIVINQVNIGSDHRMVISNIKLDVEVEREKLMTKRPSNVDATTRMKKTIPVTTRTRRY